MKNRISLLVFVAVACVLLGAALGWAASFGVVGATVNVNNTTYTGGTNAFGTYTVPRQTLAFQHGALANTNDVKLVTQVSIDLTNWLTIDTQWAQSTNAAVVTNETVVISHPAASIYRRILVTTTNSQDIGLQ